MSLPGDLIVVALAVFLVAAAVEDLTRRRISNALSFGAALLALTLQFSISGFSGLLSGLGGLAVGLTVFAPFFLMRGMGAGDVKAMAAAGAFLSPLPSLLAAGLSLVAGAALGIGVLVLRRGLPETGAGTAAAQRFPYAIAIAVGTMGAVYWTVFR